MSDEVQRMPCDVEVLETALKKIDLGLPLTPAQYAAWLNRPPPAKRAVEQLVDEIDVQFEAGHA